jgi:hypothetical protein
MVIHQTIGMTKPTKTGNSMLESVKKKLSIPSVNKDGFKSIPSRSYMINCTWKFKISRFFAV